MTSFMDADKTKLEFAGTVKPVYNNHPGDPKFVAVVEKWSLFRCSFIQ